MLNVNDKLIDHDQESERIRKEIAQLILDYPSKLNRMVTDAPIEVLCLPKVIEKLLTSNGCYRVYHVIDLDFAKIEWLNNRHARILATRLDQFISVL